MAQVSGVEIPSPTRRSDDLVVGARVGGDQPADEARPSDAGRGVLLAEVVEITRAASTGS